MPDTTLSQPLSVRPQADINRDAARERRLNDPTFSELGTAALMQGPTAALFNAIGRSPLLWEADDSFSLHPDDTLFKSLTDGIDPAYWPQFADAVSVPHAFYIKSLAENKQRYREQLAAAGASGTAASIVASLADPVYLAAGLASGGAGALASGSRLNQMRAAGLVGGAAFTGIEAGKRHEDPIITAGEVALAGASGFVGGAVAAGTSHLGRTSRFFAGGAGQAAPQAAYDVLSDADRHDVMLNILPQFFLGAVTSAIGPRTKDHAVRMDKAARNAMKEVELEIVRESGQPLTPKGEVYFAEQTRGPDFATSFEHTTRYMNRDQPFIAAMERLAGLEPNKKLNRSEVDAILEGTGYKTGNQGWPTVEDMQGYIEGMRARGSVDVDGIERISNQLENESGISTPIGQDRDTHTPPPPGVASDATTAGGAVGAASPTDPAFAVRRLEKINEQPGDLNLDGVPYDPASFPGVRISAGSMASRLEDPEIVRASNMLSVDNVPKRSGMVYYTAPDAQKVWHAANTSRLFTVNKDAHAAHVAEERAAGREPMKPLDFFHAATDAYESGIPSGNVHIDKVVANVRAIRKADWERMQRHGVAGAVDSEFDPNVIDRYTDRVALDEAIVNHTYDSMLEDIIERIKKHPGNADIANDPVKVRAVAKSWLDNAATQHDQVSIEAAHTLDHDSVAIYAEKLRRAVPELTEQQINDIVWKTGPAKNSASTPAKLRRQTRLDSAWENPALGNFKLNDILVRNIEEIERMNSQYMNGRAAMAEVYRQFSTTDRNIESLPQLLDYLERQANDRGINSDVVKADIARIEFMAKEVLGIPRHASTTFTRISRMLRSGSFARVINTATGLRNFTEIAGSIAENGFTAITKQIMPALGDMMDRFRNGHASSQAAIDLHQMGIGAGDLTHKLLPVAEEGNYVPTKDSWEYRLNKKIRVADRALQHAAKWTSTWSLIGPMQTALENINGRMVSQRWLDMAQGKVARLSEARMKAATLTPAMEQRIIDQLNLPGTVAYDATSIGNVWAGFNWNRWTDIEAATALRQSIFKTNRRQVYAPHASELAMWMDGDVAKIFTQLRTFMLGSWESKTLFNAKMHDMTAVRSMGTQLVSKAIAYAGLTYLYAIARPDREKFLKDRMDPTKVAKAAFSNSEFTSIIPMGVDAVQAIRGRQPEFAFSRTTGLGDAPGLSGLLLSNPTADTIDKVARLAGVPVDKALGFFGQQAGLNRNFDPRITQQDIKKIQGGLPWQRMLGIDQFFRQVTEQAPKERR